MGSDHDRADTGARDRRTVTNQLHGDEAEAAIDGMLSGEA